MKIITLICTASLLLTQFTNAAAEKANPLTTALGATGAQAVFSNYMAIAELADLFGAKAYDKKKVTELATMYGKLTEGAKESLTDLIDSGKLNDGDSAAVREMVVINDLLAKMSGCIVAYAKDPSEDNEAAYDKNRQKAWKAISKFLGIQEE
jgi:hypothetical protein